MPLSLPGYTRTDRLFEWIMALTMVLLSLTLAHPAETFERSALRPLLEAGFSEDFLASTFGLMGALRACALFANGRIPTYGPWARNVGAFVGSLIWSQMAAVLLYDSIRTGLPALTAPIFLGLAIGEVASCYRSVFDAGRRAHPEKP
jgi:hypothetical protein